MGFLISAVFPSEFVSAPSVSSFNFNIFLRIWVSKFLMTKYPLLESVVIIYIIMLSDIAAVRNSAFFYFAPENVFFFLLLFPPMLPILKAKIFSLLPHTLFTSLIFVLSDADVNLVLSNKHHRALIL